MIAKDYSDNLLCPSYSCGSESKLLGVKQEDGTIAILPKPISISEGFSEICLNQGFKPEEKFRFVGKCAKSGCQNWQNNQCLIAEKAVDIIKKEELNTSLPICAIRPQCRWYHQEKSNACKICKYVNTKVPKELFEPSKIEF